jgi:PIN domain nuclease of toxin-antitoxin system
MNLLLDTHALIWVSSNSQQLSARALAAIQDQENVAYFSIVSLWELVIKQQIGKFSDSHFALDQQAVDRLIDAGYQLLSFQPQHLWKLKSLELHHRDPFDRALIAQAAAENLTLVTRDAVFNQYPVSTLW